MFVSKDEIENLGFDDCRIESVEISGQTIDLWVEALIIEPKNSQNEQFTRSYADRTRIRLENCRIVRAVKEGYRSYSADDVLLEEIPDQPLNQEQAQKILKQAPGHYLYDMKKTERQNEIVLGIEEITEDPTGIDADSYQVLIECRQVTASWERYLNRVS